MHLNSIILNERSQVQGQIPWLHPCEISDSQVHYTRMLDDDSLGLEEVFSRQVEFTEYCQSFSKSSIGNVLDEYTLYLHNMDFVKTSGLCSLKQVHCTLYGCILYLRLFQKYCWNEWPSLFLLVQEQIGWLKLSPWFRPKGIPNGFNLFPFGSAHPG